MAVFQAFVWLVTFSAGRAPWRPICQFMGQPSESHLSLCKLGLGVLPDDLWERAGLQTLVLAENDQEEISDLRSWA